jgi:hypothetical protein
MEKKNRKVIIVKDGWEIKRKGKGRRGEGGGVASLKFNNVIKK